MGSPRNAEVAGLLSEYEPECIISGGAKGADSLARQYANEHAIAIVEYKPEWDKYGRAAGFIRNTDIVNNSDMIIAFWDGKSKGTKHSIGLAHKLNKQVIIIRYEDIQSTS